MQWNWGSHSGNLGSHGLSRTSRGALRALVTAALVTSLKVTRVTGLLRSAPRRCRRRGFEMQGCAGEFVALVFAAAPA